MDKPIVAILPVIDAFARAVTDAGGLVGEPEDADALVWLNPRDPAGLGEVLARSPARWVQLPVAGIEAFFEHGVIDPARTWSCAKAIYGDACAEHALGLIVTAARLLHRHARGDRWWPQPILEGPTGERAPRRVAGSTAVIVGTGGIGRSLARMLEPAGVRVIGVSRSGAPADGFARVEPVARLGEVLGEADWVVVAAAATPETERMFDAAMLARMKPDGWLINVARGTLVDTDALVDALRAGSIAGAMLDVTDPEPLPDDHPLWGFDDVVITSHTANTAAMAIPDLAALVERNVRAFAEGRPLEGLVDPALGY